MTTQIIKVYYDQNALPYKDKERTVHFPITGSTFVGSSDTTKIRFYVDGYLADENALWISVSKRADGTQGSQFLTTGTDGDGDKYREMTLSGWYTAKKGDLYISLKGYQGGSTGYWDNETGMYVVQGVPVIRATGSIKLAINYAPVGEYPYYEDEMASFQDLVAQLGGKLNITSGIVVVSDVSIASASLYTEGQLVYDKTSKSLYVVSNSAFVSFFSTYDRATLDIRFNDKVDKLTTSGEYAYTHKGSTQGQTTVSEDVVYSGIPRRTSSGQLKVPTTPTDNSDATSKKYVDDSISSAVSSVYKYKGSVATYSDLPTTGNEVGDVYNVEDTGDNYAWTGTDWDKLSGTVDLEGYYTKEQTNALLDTKADKSTTYTKIQTDELLNEKANTSGEYPLLTVGKSLTTKQIENISEDTGSTQTNPFLFQGTGTNDNTTRTPTAPVAKHLELRGNSVIWNQLLPIAQLQQTNTSNGVTATNNGDGSFTMSGTATGGTAFVYMFAMTTSTISSLDSTHKYMVLFNGQLSGTFTLRATCELSGVTTYVYGNEVFTNVDKIKDIWIKVEEGNSCSGKAYIMVIDLTKVYGAGKEPTSYLQFIRDYPLPYYAYNEGELKSCSSSKLITTGRNQFDGVLEQGSIDNSGQEQDSILSIRSKNYIKVIAGQTYKFDWENITFDNGVYLCEYNANKTFIQRNWLTGTQATPQNAYRQLSSNTQYVKFVFSVSSGSIFPTGHNVCLYLIWDGSKTGYAPYIKHEYDLPSVELRSVGDIYDTITPNGVHTQKIGVVDLGTLDWNYDPTTYPDNPLFYASLSNTKNAGELRCPLYKNGAIYGWATLPNGYARIGFNELRIHNDSYTDATAFKLAMNGVYLYYELETPIISEVSAFAENIEVDDFGTMEFVPSDSTEEIIVPQGNKFFYPADYVLFIDDLYERSKDGGETSDAYNFVTQSELEDAISDIPTPDVEGELNVINATDITNNILSAEQYALIRNGKPTLIKGTLLNMLNPILLTSSYLETFGMIIGANSSGNYTAIKYYEIYQSGTNYVIQLYSNKRIEFSNLYSINGKEIPNYPSSPTIPQSLVYDTDNTLKYVSQSFSVIQAPSSTTLTAEEVSIISNGAIFLGSSSNKFLTYEKIVFFPLGESSFGENGGLALCVNGFVPELRSYRINSQNVISINDATTKRTRLSSIATINGKNIPDYPSSTGTFVLKCVNGTLTWVAE